METKSLSFFQKIIIIIPFIAFFNYEFIDGFGTTDILVDIIFFFSIFKISIDYRNYIILLVLFFSLGFGVVSFLISNINSFDSNYTVAFGFFYKNFKIFEVFVIAKANYKLINKINLKKYTSIILILFISWSLYYIIFLRFNSIGFVSPRISFPFGDYSQSNAHLFSHCFGFVLMLYIFFIKRKFSYCNISLIFLSIILLQFTGSRNYIFSIFIPFIFFYRTAIIDFIKNYFLKIIIIIFSSFMLFNKYISAKIDYEQIKFLFERVYNFAFLEDSSSTGRLRKLKIGLEEFFEGPIIFGKSIASTKVIWFDGMLISVLIQFGLAGFILITFYTLKTYFSVKEKYLKFLFLYMLIGNIITEFLYVTRGLIFTLFVILFLNYHEKRININNV